MKGLVFSAAIAISAFTASAQEKIEEGSITYIVEWTLPPSAPPQMAAMLPKEMKVYFKGDSSSTVSKGGFSSTNIMNYNTEYFRILLDIPMANKKFCVPITPADKEDMKDKLPDVTLTLTVDNKTILNYKAEKYNIKDKTTGAASEGWFTKDISIIPNSLSYYFDAAAGVPLEFQSVQNGMTFKAKVKEVKKETVPAGIFGVPKDYEEITFTELKGMMGGPK